MKKLAELFFSFMKVGALTIGGGYAMLPMLEREIVDKHKWATEDELLDYFSIAQVTPGVIAVNTATFIGQKTKGVAGGICATLGLAFPSLVVITLVASLINNFADLPAVQNAFAGVRACVSVLIINTVVKLVRKSIVNVFTLVVFLAVFAGAVFTSLSPVIFVLLSAVAGIVARNLEARVK